MTKNLIEGKIAEFEKKFYPIECVTPGNEFVLDTFVAKRSEVIEGARQAFTELLEAQKSEIRGMLEGMKQPMCDCGRKVCDRRGWNLALDQAIEQLR